MDVSKCNIYLGNLKIKTGYFGQYKFYEDTPPVQSYVTFSSPNTFTIKTANTTKNWDGNLYYSTDTQHWNTWDGTSTLHSSSSGDTKYLYIRGSGNHVITGNVTNCQWTITGSDVDISGNTETLLDYQDFENAIHPTMGYYCFRRWMYSNSALRDCSNLIMGSDTVANYGYASCFYYCTALTKPPQITASRINAHGCDSMFYLCQALLSAPELPAQILSNHAYYNMFYGAISITTPPSILPCLTLYDYVYYQMFYGCRAMTRVPSIKATTIPDTFVCYCMFRECTNLEQIPALYPNYLRGSSYGQMFEGCSKIKMSTTQTGEYQYAWRLPPTGTGSWNNSNATNNMFVSTGGTYTGSPSLNTTYYTSNEIVY